MFSRVYRTSLLESRRICKYWKLKERRFNS